MDLEIVILSEVSQTEEVKHHIIRGIQKKEKYKKLHMLYENLLNFTSHIFFFRIHFSYSTKLEKSPFPLSQLLSLTFWIGDTLKSILFLCL